MKHNIKIQAPVEKRGFLGIQKTVMVTRSIEVDGKIYNKMQKEAKNHPYSIEEMILYDEIFDEWDDQMFGFGKKKFDKAAWAEVVYGQKLKPFCNKEQLAMIQKAEDAMRGM